MTEQKFCKDCKHSSINLVWCCNPKHGTTLDLITGEEVKNRMFTKSSREYSSCCGINGTWWEPKPPSTWQKVKTYFQ